MTPSILVVDDSLTVRMDLAEALEGAGLHPLACATLAEARQHLAREAIELVILDVVLPDGDGIELLREMRAGAGRASVILLSTEAEVKDRIRGLRTGADDYVGKPYDTGYLVARAKELVRSHSPEAGPAPATLLVIDDSPTFREALRKAFADAGYHVLTASNGEEGLRVAASSRPTAVVVDSVMPGIDGGTVIRKIRMDAALRRMPCVLVTGSELEDRAAEPRALDAGADAFVRKDEDLAVILARVGAVLRGAAAQRIDSASLLGPMRVLAVDDSPTYLYELSDVLRDEGYDVIVAHSGEEALDMLAVQPVDCILLDVQMPGLGGHETCRRIKSAPGVRDIPLLLVTASEARSAAIDGFGTGADDFISKSSDHDVLRARVRAQLRRKQFEDEHRRAREELLRVELDASEQRSARAVAEAKAALVDQLERKNRELEAFGYSVSHDLKAPVRSISGFSQILLEENGAQLDESGRGHLLRIQAAARRMGQLIDDLLKLSQIGRASLDRTEVDLSRLAAVVVEELRRREPERTVEVAIQEGLTVRGDSRLLRVLLENLIGNAWKFTSKTSAPRIEVGAALAEGTNAFFVRDNGAGFDPRWVSTLFAPFRRLHKETDFAGTGIGLATVHRIVDRHGGRVWAEGAVGRGATFRFTIP
ncbi:MAG TPA: response regulator [Polyangiaceae bacterium]|nr:response regulator [Polyangiaceae bacterium]